MLCAAPAAKLPVHDRCELGECSLVPVDPRTEKRTDVAPRSNDFVFLDDALNALAERAPRKARVVELRFFGGLSVDETAEVLRVSSITVMRKWKTAKAWLYRELTTPSANGPRTLGLRR